MLSLSAPEFFKFVFFLKKVIGMSAMYFGHLMGGEFAWGGSNTNTTEIT